MHLLSVDPSVHLRIDVSVNPWHETDCVSARACVYACARACWYSMTWYDMLWYKISWTWYVIWYAWRAYDWYSMTWYDMMPYDMARTRWQGSSGLWMRLRQSPSSLLACSSFWFCARGEGMGSDLLAMVLRVCLHECAHALGACVCVLAHSIYPEVMLRAWSYAWSIQIYTCAHLYICIRNCLLAIPVGVLM